MGKARTLNPYDMEERIHNLENSGGGGGGSASVIATAVSTGTENYADLLNTLYSYLGTNQSIEVDGLILKQVGKGQFSAVSADGSTPVVSVITIKETGSTYDFWNNFGIRNAKGAYRTTAGLTIKLIQG